MKKYVLALFVAEIACIASHSAVAQDQKVVPSEDFTITLSGDALIMTPVDIHQDEPRFKGLLNAIRDGDARYTNLEEIYPGPTAYSGPASAMWTDPDMLKQLQWMGFNLFSTANNHSMDFGIQGVLDTMQVLKENRAVYAGMGKTQEEARRPGYLMTPHGRVALIHAVSSTPAYNAALDPRGDMSGRPGPNVLRYQTIYNVDSSTYAVLQKARQELNPSKGSTDGVTGTGAARMLSFPAAGHDYDAFIPPVFQVSDKPGIITKVNPDDLAAMVHSVKSARSFADYVVVSTHSHEGNFHGDGPPEFLVEYAHAAIDAGADIFVSTGPHVLRGIEIYKGKVIIYSIGDLFFQHQLQGLPLAYYKQFHLGSDALPGDVIAAEDAANPQNGGQYQSAVAKVIFRDGNPVEITMTPISLTPKFPRGDGGVPELADAKQGAEILDHLQKMCETYGTKMTIEKGVGIIKIGNSQ